MKKVVLISVGQPSTNPRLVKEADALQKAGFDVYVVYSYWTQWAWEADKVLFSKVKWTSVLAGGSPFQDKLTYLLTRIRVKLFMWIAQNLTLKYGIAETAKGRTYPALLKKASAIKADIYIAHVLAALPAAVTAAKKNKARCGFDAEDFHRQEVTDDINAFDYKISSYLEDKYLPLVDYMTASSPLIADSYARLYNRRVDVLLNVFPRSTASITNNNTLKLFWFSQTVGINRGLETVIESIASISSTNFELHLLGNLPEGEFKNYLDGKAAVLNLKIFTYQPIKPDDIPGFAMKFDIGLAIETPVPLNRDICLTNKLFTYLQAGLAIIASNTSAQQAFMNQHTSIGKLYNNTTSLADALLYFDTNREALNRAKTSASALANADMNWETESEKFIKIINQVLQ